MGLDSPTSGPILHCSKEVLMLVLQLMAGAFIVTVPALVLADVLDERHELDR